jgi:hypothetical protein
MIQVGSARNSPSLRWCEENRSQKVKLSPTSRNMNIILIVMLGSLVALALFWWFKNPSLKGAPPRTWPVSRAKMGTKPKLTKAA